MSIIVASSVIAFSQAACIVKLKPEYVDYDLKMLGTGAYVYTLNDVSGYPIIVTEGYPAEGEIIEANVTIDGVLCKYPTDFEYNWTIHFEINAVTGEGWGRVISTLTFKNLAGKPTLIEWEVVRCSGFVAPYTNMLCQGDFRLTGTGRFSNVEGFGMSELTIQTGVRHYGLIKGWPSAPIQK